jgi:hypothetical protein
MRGPRTIQVFRRRKRVPVRKYDIAWNVVEPIFSVLKLEVCSLSNPCRGAALSRILTTKQ